MAEEFDPNATGSSGYITSSTPITTNIPTSRPFDRPQSVATVQPTTASEADLIRNYNEMSDFTEFFYILFYLLDVCLFCF